MAKVAAVVMMLLVCGMSLPTGLSFQSNGGRQFARTARQTQRAPTSLWANNDKDKKGFNPFQGISDMLSNMDDVIDDFMFKRMGNGEVFYGQRKFQPSNRPNTKGKYNGMGLSDKLKIDVTREVKEEAMERKRQRQKQQEEEP
jgi:hypothetical protein